MILLIDAGNTRIKFDRLLEDGTRAASGCAFTLAELDVARQWLRGLPQRPTRALGVNVAGASAATALEAVVGCAIDWLQAGRSALGVRNGYLDPAQLGTDRWAAMVGLAWHERLRTQAEAAAPCGALLAIFGTATTIDTLWPAQGLAAQGDAGEPTVFDFRGGLILPGPAMMLASLSTGTANLPQAQGDIALYPTHTHQAIVTGMAAAQAGALLRQWMAASDDDATPPEVYVSGGGWPMVQAEVQRLLNQAFCSQGLAARPVRLLDAPVLDGLACLARNALN
ncbi:MAG TPA: type III pantothenate kinase [Pusillimonas sp.]|uniref:type III pantothenate kinase n=1 Tax=Pusillimonas sp. TaxID=3040095 RepID=UPI002CA74B32|nr:type III pantothenate kinase [Pusillimonas sp.]HUH86534.1 type III pantothenate kinase [Pusillimonas sp.]